MPFNINGDWIPEPTQPKRPKHPVKVITEKRGHSIVTVILNLPLEENEMKQLCSILKQRLGCGGSVKDEKIEIQGEKVAQVKEYLSQTRKKS